MTRLEVVRCDARLTVPVDTTGRPVGRDRERCGQELRIDLARTHGWELSRFADFCPLHTSNRGTGA